MTTGDRREVASRDEADGDVLADPPSSRSRFSDVIDRLQSSGQTLALMDVRNINGVPPFITKDGSEIRELLAYRNSCIQRQSLAEARLPAGGATQEHFHAQTEEIYFITEGRARIRVEAEEREVAAGDAIAIPPGMKHKIWNLGPGWLRLLCCCAPAYEHADTFLTEPAKQGG